MPDLPNRLIEVHTKMFSFIARRLGLLIPTFFGITLLTFALIRMIPGDPVEVMMGERRVDPEMHAQAMERLGLNKPLYAQYLDYVGKLAQGGHVYVTVKDGEFDIRMEPAIAKLPAPAHSEEN